MVVSLFYFLLLRKLQRASIYFLNGQEPSLATPPPPNRSSPARLKSPHALLTLLLLLVAGRLWLPRFVRATATATGRQAAS